MDLPVELSCISLLAKDKDVADYPAGKYDGNYEIQFHGGFGRRSVGCPLLPGDGYRNVLDCTDQRDRDGNGITITRNECSSCRLMDVPPCIYGIVLSGNKV